VGPGVTSLGSVSIRLLPPGGGDYETVVLGTTDVMVGGPAPVPVLVTAAPTLRLYPNPFNPRVQVDFSLGSPGYGLLEIYDMRGRRVTTLWQGTTGESGLAAWDGRDEQGRALPSGIYTFRLQKDDGSQASARGTLLR